MNPFQNAGLEHALRLPDPWQRDAVSHLRAGRDVVVSAPTGAGKTYVFELLIEGGWKGQAVFTVPTRALANDKLLEWRRRGWNVGIMTGDVVDKPDAPVVVATLETQRGRLLCGEGPSLLVIDEYQLIADGVRGPNYELAIALAPSATRLLLLSGSVGNPGDVVSWLERLGRPATLVSTRNRPVPLEEVFVESLRARVPQGVRGFWPGIVARALASNLGPILLFAPRRRNAEELARQIAAAVPCPSPLFLDSEQERLAGPELARLLSRRVAFHHSGLTYAQRAHLVEPLAKGGKLRVVVATTGLAAGINFSLRSVAVTESEYLASNQARRIEPDALLQMFGRAGRRGLDTTGYVLVVPDRPRLTDARPRFLKRSPHLDWPSLLAVMAAASDRGDDAYTAASAFVRRLFLEEIPRIGFEFSAEHAQAPCGLRVDAARRQLARSTLEEILVGENWMHSLGSGEVPLEDCRIRTRDGRWRPALSVAETVQAFGPGTRPRNPAEKPRRHVRALIVWTCDADGRWRLAPFVRRLLARQPGSADLRARREDTPANLIERASALADVWAAGGRITTWEKLPDRLVAVIDHGHQTVAAHRVEQGVGIVGYVNPEVRAVKPEPCRRCQLFEHCSNNEDLVRGPAKDWLRLGLVTDGGHPTPRGRLFSHFIHAEGLAIAAGLEDVNYPVEDLAHDLASLRAGSRFALAAGRTDRLAIACRATYPGVSIRGFLEQGLPLDYGHDAGAWMRQIIRLRGGQPTLNEHLTRGDLERCLVEWRSLLNHCLSLSPDLHMRLPELQGAIRRILASIP